MLMWIDFPTHGFDPDTGTLHVNLMSGNRRLLPRDIGYVGYMRYLSGQGSGAGSNVEAFDEVPFEPNCCSMSVQSVAQHGFVSVQRGNRLIEFEPGDEWTTSWSYEEDWNPGCVVTVTYGITNHGRQDRTKIEYYPTATAQAPW